MAKKSGKGHNHHKNDNDHGKHHNDNDHGKHNSHNKSDDAIVNVLDQPDSDGYIVGTQGDDVLVATAGTQVLAGFGGNDRLVAADGVLTLPPSFIQF